MTERLNEAIIEALWRIYRRPGRPTPWTGGGNLPWDEPAFAERMLREHLDQSHGAASRVFSERELQLEWLWSKLDLKSGDRLLDITCGPGLYAVEFARRGCQIIGIDFSPASIVYARQLAANHNVTDFCTFIERDVRQMEIRDQTVDAAMFLYGQLAVFPKDQAQNLLTRAWRALKPGGKLAVELLNQDRVDKTESTWWFTDETGLWGDRPFLHLGERFWNEAEQLSIERYHILHLETGQLAEIHLCDQTYAVETMVQMMERAGFATVDTYMDWDGLPLYDAADWVVYVAGS